METTQKKQWWHRLGAVLFSILLMIALAAGLYCGTAYAAEGTQSIQKNLLNGSFEEGQSWSGNYSQPDQSAVPAWNTTAFQGKIELFRKNTGIYIPGVELKPTDGTYAAELNADEESTLYQIVDTYDSSVYEWGLDHGARNGTDIMALVIGPNQSEFPSKPSKDGRDQFMQMVDWLNSDANPEIKDAISGIAAGAEPQQYTLYSKKFGTHGSFLDNQGNNAFSLTPSTIYTEEWHIWILSSNKAGTGVTENPWSHFGSNGENDEENASGSQSNGLDLNKYYLYTVPAGQTKTLFGFVSVGYVDSITTADKAKTYGNFVDNINFTLYHPFSGSSTTHGSVVIIGSDGSVIGGAAGNDGGLTTYIEDGETLTVQAIVKQADVTAGCEFVGLYYTYRDSNTGTLKTDFLKLAGNEVSESATDEEKVGKWIKSTGTNGDITYTYYLRNLTSSVDLHFVFIKNPTITYDPNGGLPYVVRQTGNGETDNNVYSFKPNSGEGISIENSFIAPYVSHAAEGQNDGWKFMGWKLTGDTVDTIPSGVVQVNADKLGSLILPAEHTLACDYVLGGNNGAGAPQYFKIYNGYVTLNKQVQQNATSGVTGVTWTTDNSGTTPSYANLHKGLTMVAQWRWRQAFVPQKHTDEGYVASAEGGTVEITSVTNTSDENYNDAYNSNGGKAYFAAGNEQVTVKATPASGYVFEGWYGEDGKLITTNPIYSYAVTANSVKTCYARFSNTVTQTYVRQVMNVNSRAWEETTDDTIGTLGRYTYADAVGTPISSTARAGEGYKFVGWYNASGIPVDASMLTNNGATLSYTTTETKTYYARFMKNVAITVTGNSETVTYDGNTYSVDGYTVKYTVGGTSSEALPAGISLTAKATAAANAKASGKTAGTYTMLLSEADFIVTNESPLYAYTLQVIPGKLTINPSARTITATGYDAPYDGEPHGITVTGITADDTVTYSTNNETWTEDAPKRTNVQAAETIWVKVENPNYTTVKTSATITITKRPITITANSGEKFYDGTALTGGFTYTQSTSTPLHEGLVGGQELTATTTGSLTKIGSTANTVGDVVIKRDGQDVTENYAITRVDGLLTVKAAEGITVRNTPAQIEVYAGNDMIWTVTVENNGSHDAKGLTLADDLEGIAITAPAGIDPAAFSVPEGSTVAFTVKLPDAAAGTYVNHVSVTQPKADSTTVKLAEADAAAVTVRTPPAPSTGGNRPTPPTKEETYIMDYRDCTANTACPIWPYTDADAKAWYHDGVHFCLENGLMVGYSDGIFQPNAPTTRSMLVVMLWRLNGSPVVNYALDFDDVAEDAWYTEAVRWAKSEGVAGGYGNGKFGPNDTLTREQMVAMLYRYTQYKGYDVSVGEDTNILSFDDATTVAEYAIPAMQWACGSGVVGGKDAADGSGLILDPKGSTTRAQMATMVMRFCAEIVK